MAQRPKKLRDHVRDAIRLKHDSIRTEASSVTWMRRDMLFQNTRHPNAMAGAEIEAFLTHLAVAQQGAASTQHQALSAVLLLYRDVRKSSLDLHIAAMRANRPTRVPTVLTTEETLKAIERLSGTQRLRAKRLYGGGVRRMECLRLRVTDLDFTQQQIIVRAGTGMEDRVTMRPASLVGPPHEH
jgi:integrase